MNNVLGVVKFVGAWFCLIAACVFLVLAPQPFGMAGVCALTSIAFSQAPVTA